MDYKYYAETTPQLVNLAKMTKDCREIDSELYTKYDVKRGLRDLDGKGGMAGLTHI